jgi:diamine N-acetyltransferase
MSLQFCRIELEEVRQLVEFAAYSFRAAWQSHPLNAGPDFDLYCQGTFTEDKFRAALAQSNSAFYWAKHSDQPQPLGYVKLNWNVTPILFDSKSNQHNWAQIERIYVHPQFLGNGWGGKLLQFAHSTALSFGFSHIWLSVWKAAPQSIRFYEKHGYKIAGEEVFWVGNDPQEDWVMILVL